MSIPGERSPAFLSAQTRACSTSPSYSSFSTHRVAGLGRARIFLFVLRAAYTLPAFYRPCSSVRRIAVSRTPHVLLPSGVDEDKCSKVQLRIEFGPEEGNTEENLALLSIAGIPAVGIGAAPYDFEGIVVVPEGFSIGRTSVADAP